MKGSLVLPALSKTSRRTHRNTVSSVESSHARPYQFSLDQRVCQCLGMAQPKIADQHQGVPLISNLLLLEQVAASS